LILLLQVQQIPHSACHLELLDVQYRATGLSLFPWLKCPSLVDAVCFGLDLSTNTYQLFIPRTSCMMHLSGIQSSKGALTTGGHCDNAVK
jgi:hypothetical protein